MRDVAEKRESLRTRKRIMTIFILLASGEVSAYEAALCSKKGIIDGVGADQISALGFHWAYQLQIKRAGLDAGVKQKLLWPATGSM